MKIQLYQWKKNQKNKWCHRASPDDIGKLGTAEQNCQSATPNDKNYPPVVSMTSQVRARARVGEQEADVIDSVCFVP